MTNPLFPNDPHRPTYHLMPPANWMNDPNGLLLWKGETHVFYQYNPNGAFWGTMHWGHAASKDLVHWTHLPVALAPTPGGPDWDGCFSGCAVDNDGVPTFLYTGVSPEVQCLAVSHDDMITWEKYAGNPVIAAPPDGDVTGFRDPCVWKEGNEWVMLIGSGWKGVGGTALLYTSADLIHWTYQHPLCIGHREETGEMWECPDFFPLGDKHILLVSPVGSNTVLYFVGTYADRKFTPEVSGDCDFGRHFYAAKSLADASGRRLLWGWSWEGRTVEAQKAAGWAGVMSLPRELTLRSDNTLGFAPATELQTLRGAHRHFTGALTEPVQGDSLEILAEIAPGDAEAFGLRLRAAPDGSEQTLLTYDRATQRLGLHREQSSLSPDVNRDGQSGKLALAPDETLQLHVFLDRSIIEVFANGRACLTSRIYPARTDSLSLEIYSYGGNAEVRSLDIWDIRAI